MDFENDFQIFPTRCQARGFTPGHAPVAGARRRAHDRRVQPHPRNAPGAFYVVDECCTRCGVPETAAPDLFAYDDEHCWVRRQPASGEELARMLEAIAIAELGCIRYRGKDVVIRRRLEAMGEGGQIDP